MSGAFCVALVLLVLVTGCRSETAPGQSEAPLQIFCAASLSGSAEQLAGRLGIPVVINSAGSNTLIRQVVLGAEADLLLLADDLLAKAELVPRGYKLYPIASNALVVIASASSKVAEATPEDNASLERLLNGAKQLAIADAKTAPLGAYTSQALEGLELSRPTVPLQDARAVLSSVALGHAELGIVYRSDALSEGTVRTVASFGTERHRPILYIAALGPQADARSRAFIDALQTEPGRELLERAGFLPPPAAR